MAITESINLMTKHFKNVSLACTHTRARNIVSPPYLILFIYFLFRLIKDFNVLSWWKKNIFRQFSSSLGFEEKGVRKRKIKWKAFVLR